MLTEQVDYDLDTHPITAGAGVMEIRAGRFGMQLHVKRRLLCGAIASKNGGRTVEMWASACARPSAVRAV